MWRARHPGKRSVVAGAIVVLTLLVVTPAVLRALVYARLRAMVSDQLNAELTIGRLEYTWPYGIDAADAVLRTPGPDGKPLELLRVASVRLRLARSPLRSGPLVIESLLIDDPEVHLIRLNGGIVGRRTLVKHDDAQKKYKPSEMFRLSRFAITGGKVRYEDRDAAGSVPLAWSGLNVDLNTTRRSESAYAYRFAADGGGLASLRAAGSFDIDSLVLTADTCTLSASFDSASQESPLPADLQQWVREFSLRGKLNVRASGTLPVENPAAAVYRSRLELGTASAKLPQWGTQVDRLELKLDVGNNGGRPKAEIDSFEAAAGDAVVRLDGASAELDPSAGTWEVKGLRGRVDPGRSHAGLPPVVRAVLGRFAASGAVEFEADAAGPVGATDPGAFRADAKVTPVEARVQPPGFAKPLEQIAPVALRLEKGLLHVAPLRAACGPDLLFVKSASLDLTALPARVRVVDLAGCITFGSPHGTYPKPVSEYLAQLNPSGPWFFEGGAEYRVGATEKPFDCALTVHTARGGLAVSDKHVRLYDINAVLTLTPAQVRAVRFDAGVLNGSLSATGMMQLGNVPRYELSGKIRGLDLNELARVCALPDRKPTPLSGLANLTLSGHGTIPTGDRSALDAIAAEGEFEVHDGDFWRLPVMQSIKDNADVRGAITVSEAAALFSIDRGQIHLARAAVSAPVLGAEGSGTIDFHGKLNLNVIATVLGEWRDKLDLGDHGVANRVIGAVQQGLNVATRQAVYEITLGGTTDRPAASAVLSPYLSRQATRLVQFLNHESRPGGMLEFLHDEGAADSARHAAARQSR